MLCRKFELIQTNIFRVMSIFKMSQFSEKSKGYSPWFFLKIGSKIFGQIMELFINNPILIRIHSNLLHKIRTCTCVRNYKNSFGAIFDKDHVQNYSIVSIMDEGQNYMTFLVEILKKNTIFCYNYNRSLLSILLLLH